METKIFVGNLSFVTTEEDLKDLFSQAGTVVSTSLIKDRDTGQSKGFAFIEMSNQAEAENAIHMFNGQSLGDRQLKVNLARPPEKRGPGGRGGYGRGGGGGYNRGGGGNRGGKRRQTGGGSRRY